VAQRAGSWARERIASTWADLIGMGFEAGLICFGPSQGSKVTFARVDQWIGTQEMIDPDVALAEAFRRYLSAYGPATSTDFAQWFAGNKLPPDAARTLVASLGDELEEVQVGRRRAWLRTADIDASAERPPSCVNLVPQYDCYILGSRFGREQLVPEAAKARLFAYKNGRFEGAAGRPLLLIDGIAAGMWEQRKQGKQTKIRVEPFVDLTHTQGEQLEAEVARIGQFLDTDVVLVLGLLE